MKITAIQKGVQLLPHHFENDSANFFFVTFNTKLTLARSFCNTINTSSQRRMIWCLDGDDCSILSCHTPGQVLQAAPSPRLPSRVVQTAAICTTQKGAQNDKEQTSCLNAGLVNQNDWNEKLIKCQLGIMDSK